MLSMAAMSSGQAGYYLGLAREDYYLKGGEPPGQWFGDGAVRLGLSGEVKPDELYNLFDGKSPDGSRSLVQQQRHVGVAEHRPGWDLTFSAPKSVSVLWSQCSPEYRRLIQDAHLLSVKAALDYLQDVAALSRRGREGKRLETTSLIVGLFEHSTSRALDPLLHTHALLMNVGVGPDGKTRTISSLSLFQNKMAAGALYRAHFSALLEQLGIKTEKHRTWFEVSNVSENLVQEFSKRRQAIEAALAEKGLSSAEAAVVAAIETRDVKEAVARGVLFDGWHRDGARYGWIGRHADALFGSFHPSRDKALDTATAASLATDRITSSQAHFTERDFIRFMAEDAQATGLFAGDIISGARAHLEHSPEIVRLGRHYGENRFTTREMLRLETSLLACAADLSKVQSHSVDADTLVASIAQMELLAEEQLKAIWHITTGTGAIAVVSGMAGTGKTRMLGGARQAWEAAGLNVLGAALAGTASREMFEGAGIESQTIAKLLSEIAAGRNPLDARTILVVDEAGMVATPEMEQLARHCRDAGAKLVLIGDERQLQPIGPGAPFMELGARFGQAVLQQIRRQTEAWARRAVKDIADGDAQKALQEFVERGLVEIHDTRDEAVRALVSQWMADPKPQPDKLILAGTRAEVGALNKQAQGERLRAGELSGDPVQLDGSSFYVKDRVVFTKPHRAMGVLNGDRGTVKGLSDDRERMTVLLDSGGQVSFEIDAIVDLSLAYASTTHRAQGATSTSTYILAGGPMQDRELSYVQASRAREKTVFFLTRLEVGDEIATLAREMERSRQKEMAHTLLRQEVDSGIEL